MDAEPRAPRSSPRRRRRGRSGPPPDDDRAAAQLRAVALLDGGEERVEVDVQDRPRAMLIVAWAEAS